MSKYTYQEKNGYRTGVIQTTRGPIHTPTFIPVTTFGDKYPLDRLVQPYLKRLSQCIMVSYHYARLMKERPEMPMFIDSGGFASLFEGSEIIEHKDCASIRTKDGEEIHPLKVLEFQEQHADLAATLDFIISPGMDLAEACRRQKLTIKNAFYALKQKRSKSLFLYASLQCWDEKSARTCAREYAKAGFDGIGIGGLVPRIRDEDYIKRIVSAVREEIPELAIHVFGIGKLEMVNLLWDLQVDSTDSSSYVREAVGNLTPRFMFLPSGKASQGPHTPLLTALSNLWSLSRSVGL
ncbi:MAG: tRNA-guanine transglycosylase [Bacillota bacterium]